MHGIKHFCGACLTFFDVLNNGFFFLMVILSLHPKHLNRYILMLKQFTQKKQKKTDGNHMNR
jgi:hypothetical protein